MEPSLALPDTNRITSAARSAADVFEDTASAAGEVVASAADSTADALDTATGAIELAGPTALTLGPKIGRVLLQHKRWLVLGLLAVAVVIVIRKRRDETSGQP